MSITQFLVLLNKDFDKMNISLFTLFCDYEAEESAECIFITVVLLHFKNEFQSNSLQVVTSIN